MDQYENVAVPAAQRCFLKHGRRAQREQYQGSFARRTVGSSNAKGPAPRCCHPSEDPRKMKVDDGRLNQTLLRPYGSVRVEVLLPVIPGVA
jgi:hypothetical protein